MIKSDKVVYSVFFVDGLLYASWLAILPTIQVMFGLTNLLFAFLLFTISVGSALLIPCTGYLTLKFGSRNLLITAFTILSICYFSLSIISSTFLLFEIVFLMGCAVGIIDITMNVLAFKIEKQNQTPLMSGFHAVFSLGVVAGALILGYLLVNSSIHFSFAFIVLLPLLFIPWWTKKISNDKQILLKRRIWIKPSKRILLLGLIALCIVVVNSTLTDWNTNYMFHVFGELKWGNTLGLAFYSFAVFLARIFGDKLRTIITDKIFIFLAIGLVAMGVVFLILASNPFLAMIGFIISGLGISVILPTIYSLAGTHWSRMPSIGISMVATIGYSGYLLAPMLMGLSSELISIQGAYYISLLFLSLIVCFLSSLKQK